MSFFTRRQSCQKLSAIGDIEGAASAKAISGGGSRPRSFAAKTIGSPAGVGSSSATLKIPDAGAAERCIDGLGDVADMDAIENLPGLYDATGFAARDLNQRILSRTVNAGEAEDGDGDAVLRAKILPGLLCSKTLAAAPRIGVRRRCLINPGAGVIAVNANRGQINHRAQMLGLCERVGAGG